MYSRSIKSLCLDYWLSSNSIESFLSKPIKTIWQSSWGGLKIHVFCGPDITSNAIKGLVDSIRNLRVGVEARHPEIVFWTDYKSLTDIIIGTINRLDIYTPRLTLFVLGYWRGEPKSSLFKTIDRIFSNKSNLSIKFLTLIENKHEKLNQNLEFFKDFGSKKNFYFEWFSYDSDNKQDELILIKELFKAGYAIDFHPLFLCGSLTGILKKYFLSNFFSELGPPIDKKILTVNGGTNNSLNYLRTFCLREVVKDIFNKDGLFKDFSCSCKNANLFISTEKIAEIKNLATFSKNKNLILFDDWQYIYDGFDFM